MDFPRRKTSAYAVLKRLLELGGRATERELNSVISANYWAPWKFNQHVLTPLVRRCVRVVGDELVITHEGRAFITAAIETDSESDGDRKEIGQIVPARQPAPFRPLKAEKCHLISHRPGAMDYRDVPSLMGGQRVEFWGGRVAK